jgi:hypothetical protein
MSNTPDSSEDLSLDNLFDDSNPSLTSHDPPIPQPNTSDSHLTSEASYTMTSNQATNFKENQTSVANRMSYASLFNTNTPKATVASLAAKLYTVSSAMMVNILEAYDAMQNGNTNEEKVANTLAKLTTAKEAYKDILSESSAIDAIRNYLRRDNEATTPTDASLATQQVEIPSPTTACFLDKSTPIFFWKER